VKQVGRQTALGTAKLLHMNGSATEPGVRRQRGQLGRPQAGRDRERRTSQCPESDGPGRAGAPAARTRRDMAQMGGAETTRTGY